MKHYVVFSGATDIKILRLLRPGFRHCFLLINDGCVWTSFDPMANYWEIKTHHHVPFEYDLRQWFEGRGYKVLDAGDQKRLPSPIIFPALTCVCAIKRYMGIRDWRIQTPWQLYKHLEKRACNG